VNTPALGLEVGPTTLPLGTKVGAWRVSGFRGRGTYGAVYSVVSQGRGPPVLAALKLAVYPGDPRFEREVELLSRIRHPSVPRLLDSGLWRHPLGRVYPFVVMEWVQGEPLYAWAARRNPSSRQVLALLAQAAGALQATHEVCSVHRDVKGDNMLVRPSDGRLFLTDLGAGYFAGAARLTPLHVVPGTPEYRSPELWEYALRGKPGATVLPVARPEDDVFALGVTAYRLVTDTYPRFIHPDIVPPRQLNPRVDAQLNALILRMLSLKPEERGTAGELAAAMERGMTHAGPAADEPLFEWETLRPSQWTREELADAGHLGHRPRRRGREKALEVGQADAVKRGQVERRKADKQAPAASAAPRVKFRGWGPWLAALLALGLWPEETGSLRTGSRTTEARNTYKEEGDPASLGESAQSAPTTSAKLPDRDGISEEFPEQPLPGQLKPDAKGRCPKKQIVINGGCWFKVEVDLGDCPKFGYEYQGACYAPGRFTGRVPTAAPPGR
jgi:hypothetical protein